MEWFLFRAPSLTCLLRPLYSPHCVSPLPSQPTNLTALGLLAVSVLSLWIPLPTPPSSALSLESFCPSYTIYHLNQASVFPGKVFRCPQTGHIPTPCLRKIGIAFLPRAHFTALVILVHPTHLPPPSPICDSRIRPPLDGYFLGICSLGHLPTGASTFYNLGVTWPLLPLCLRCCAGCKGTGDSGAGLCLRLHVHFLLQAQTLLISTAINSSTQ